MVSPLRLHSSAVVTLKAIFLFIYIFVSSAILSTYAWPQASDSKIGVGLASQYLNTDAVYPRRFLAVHGKRALIEGYSENGLEVWAYPLQLIEGYRLGFRVLGATSEIAGQSILRRITYQPQAVVRTYIGSQFIVREKLFVPRGKPDAVITYTVDSKNPLDIIVHFVPVLNLMWPASIGGQDTTWNAAANSYVISEPTHNFAALIGSKSIVAHDEIFNRADDSSTRGNLAFTLRAGGSLPSTVIAVVASMQSASDPATTATKLTTLDGKWERDAETHYNALLDSALQIETPDKRINHDLAWAIFALDQAWVCNPYLGCGLVAGYGASRGARRPQYAWFFAGDAMIATHALVDAGEYSRARDALRFIAKYQDRKTGMIWHEMSQSAGLIDWSGKYSYMFVHVDITFQYLSAIAEYVSASGDRDFL